MSRLSWPFDNANHLATFLACIGIVSFLAFLRSRSLGERALSLLATCVAGGLLLCTGSRGGVLAAIGGIAVAMYLERHRIANLTHRWRWVFYTGLIGIPAILAVLIVISPFNRLGQSLTTLDAGITIRSFLYRDASIALWEQVRWGAPISYHDRYQTWSKPESISNGYAYPVNDILWVFTDAGFLIGILFLALLATLVVAGVSAHATKKRCAYFLATLVACIIASCFTNHLPWWQTATPLALSAIGVVVTAGTAGAWLTSTRQGFLVALAGFVLFLGVGWQAGHSATGRLASVDYARSAAVAMPTALPPRGTILLRPDPDDNFDEVVRYIARPLAEAGYKTLINPRVDASFTAEIRFRTACTATPLPDPATTTILIDPPVDDQPALVRHERTYLIAKTLSSGLPASRTTVSAVGYVWPKRFAAVLPSVLPRLQPDLGQALDVGTFLAPPAAPAHPTGFPDDYPADSKPAPRTIFVYRASCADCRDLVPLVEKHLRAHPQEPWTIVRVAEDGHSSLFPSDLKAAFVESHDFWAKTPQFWTIRDKQPSPCQPADIL